MNELRLAAEQAASAAAIQQAIDSLGPAGGRVVLPAMDLVLDRGLELRSNVELVGQGQSTRLWKAPGRVYPLSGYHNYGMRDVPLEYSDGLEPGMTVAVRDNVHGGFFETFARVIWVDGTWVGLDCGLHSDYHAREQPILVTSFPLVYGLQVHGAAVRDLFLDGNRAEQPMGIGACRGAAIYFIQSRDVEVSGVTETGFAGEGLGFQMCSDVRILGCRVSHNAGNGYHPGAGSTGALIEDCVADGNDQAGFYFCVRANRITVHKCTFVGNGACGVSVGTRDCNNVVVDCQIADNDGPGVLFRGTTRPTQVHSCAVVRCRISGNAGKSGRAQVDVLGDAHDLVFRDNEITGLSGKDRAGIYLAPSTERIWIRDNRIEGCFPAIVGDEAGRSIEEPMIECGVETVRAEHLRHLWGTSMD